jgi:hypothetical protein
MEWQKRQSGAARIRESPRTNAQARDLSSLPALAQRVLRFSRQL